MHPRRASLLTRWWNAHFPPLLSSCHGSLLSSCWNVIYLPPESIIFVVCATLWESTFVSQHCLTRCVLKAACFKWGVLLFILSKTRQFHDHSFSLCACALCCFHFMALACLPLAACWVALSPALCDSCHPFLIWVVSPLQSVLWSVHISELFIRFLVPCVYVRNRESVFRSVGQVHVNASEM